MLNFVSCKYNKDKPKMYKATILKNDRFFKEDTTIQGVSYKKGEENPLFLISGDLFWFRKITPETYEKTQPIINFVNNVKRLDIETNSRNSGFGIGKYILYNNELFIIKAFSVDDEKDAQDNLFLKNSLQIKKQMILEQVQK